MDGNKINRKKCETNLDARIIFCAILLAGYIWWTFLDSVCDWLTKGYFSTYFFFLRERGAGREKERERNINVRENHQLVASCMRPDQGWNLQPSYVPWPGIKPATFCFIGWCLINWATPFRIEHIFGCLCLLREIVKRHQLARRLLFVTKCIPIFAFQKYL